MHPPFRLHGVARHNPAPSPRFLSLSLSLVLAIAALVALAIPGVRAEPTLPYTYGDTLTTIMRPLINLPALVVPGESFEVWALAPPGQTGFDATLEFGANVHPLTLDSASYDPTTTRWTLSLRVPLAVPEELYDLVLTAPGIDADRSVNAVQVLDAEPSDYYFVQVTDTHLVTHLYYYETGADTDTSEVADFRAVIDDMNIIQPAFVLHTGDLINEGELEEFLGKFYWSRSQALFGALDVPLFLVAGNHDIGGWNSTPPPGGTARRNWWRYFGWPWLDAPPPGDPMRTQNYDFDLGLVHYVGLEAYVNYDGWRSSTYRDRSFIPEQLTWLSDNLTQVPPGRAKVLFYHYDFLEQIDVAALGVDMALWGHWHSVPEGNWQTPPFNLGLQSVCDDKRTFRLVRVSGQPLAPRPMLTSGFATDNLTLTYSTQGGEITGTIVNLLTEPFEQAEIRFRVPDDGMDYEVTGGTLLRVIPDGEERVFYVRVPVPGPGTVSATLRPVQVAVDQPAQVPPVGPALGPAFPNPFNPQTTIRLAQQTAGPARVAIYDVFGRLVRVLHDGPLAAGRSEVSWDGRSDSGRDLPSGSYWVRLITPDGERRLRVIRVR
jgi:hypothetical protein